jgi:penicillin-binding protein 1A
MAAGYAVFANSGYRVTPYFISRVEDASGKVLAKASPLRAGEGTPRVIDARNAFVMFSMMQDVIRGGTGARAMQLGRVDLAGKTGTTNDQMDAWFAGFQRHVCAVAWLGFDLPRSLGPNETGAVAALPIWMSYMGEVLKDAQQEVPAVPEGVVAARVNPETGLRDPDDKHGLLEYFFQENLPLEGEPVTEAGAPPAGSRPDDVRSELY